MFNGIMGVIKSPTVSFRRLRNSRLIFFRSSPFVFTQVPYEKPLHGTQRVSAPGDVHDRTDDEEEEEKDDVVVRGVTTTAKGTREERQVMVRSEEVCTNQSTPSGRGANRVNIKVNSQDVCVYVFFSSFFL